MLKITLYKNCILNETYANVFSLGLKNNKSILEHYLDTLNKKIYEIEYVYQENSGTLVFDYIIDEMSNIYDFNYMKVETIEDNETKILRYCFIQDIKLKNNLVYLEYEEDMWHSYSGKIKGINESYLDASRLVDYENGFKLNVRSLPFEYKGNLLPDFRILIGNERNDNISKAKFYLVIEIQFYKGSAWGTATERYTGFYLFTGNYGANPSVRQPYLEGLTFEQAYNALSDFELSKNTLNFERDRDTHGAENLDSFGHHYELGNVYLIPVEFGLNNLIRENYERAFFVYSHGSPVIVDFTELYVLDDSYSIKSNSLKLQEIKNILVNSDFKLISLGTLSNQIKIVNNGNDFNINILVSFTDSKFTLYLGFNNTLVNITPNFLYEVPVAELNSEQLSLLRLQRETKNAMLNEDINILNSEFIKNTAQNVANTFKTASGLVTPNLFKMIRSGINLGADLALSEVNIKEDTKILNANKNKIKAELNELNAPLYTSNNAVFGDSENFINSRYGIVAFYSNSQNDNFVKRAINNLGYIAYEFINDISKLRINDASYFIEKHINYNTISFKSVSCYGSFVRNTAKVLNGILESGIKIWYNENMEEDNYQVG